MTMPPSATAATRSGPIEAAVARQDNRARRALWLALGLIVLWGANFTVQTPDAASIQKVACRSKIASRLRATLAASVSRWNMRNVRPLRSACSTLNFPAANAKR